MDIVLATNNQGKAEEFLKMFKDTPINLLTLQDLNIKMEADETGTTFEENSEIKAIEAYKVIKKPILSDDSGLIVDALNGQPGVKSARFSGDNATDESNNKLLLQQMRGKENRQASFVADLCLVLDEKTIFHFEGKCKGEIALKEEGDKGFGYDSIFVVNGETFSSMSKNKKNKISHRYMAMVKLKDKIKDILNEK
ncbi:MAG: RdgB/HAM1 family non-canonical purine NTP pyrophosphatase [Oscillospiraceae bacterium]